MTVEREQYDEHVKDQVTVTEGGVVKADGTHLTYEEWLVDEMSADAVISIGDIAVTDFDPGSGLAQEYSSQSWILTLNGGTWKYERWFTDNSGGSEWYDAAGNAVDVSNIYVLGRPVADYAVHSNARVDEGITREATIEDIIDEIVDKAAEAYGARYDELVQPLIEQIKQEVFPFTAS